MKKLVSVSLLVFSVCFTLAAQKKQDVLVTIGKNPITRDEFKYIYERNNSNIQDPENKKTPSEYLQLFINFKLKVLEAQSLGMDTTADFTKELAGYRTELAAPYLTDISFDDKLIEETYNRMTKEVNASHILINLPENPTSEDTLEAYGKITEIRRQIAGGLNFNEAAVKYSQDPSVSQNHGDLGWFTVFQMVYPFEIAAYTTPPGEISQPFLTRYGYHLLKVNDIRKSEGEMHVAHIMIGYIQGATPEQKETARLKADSIYNLLKQGIGFSELVMKYSDDKRSVSDGGELPWFGRSSMIPEFSGPAFELKNNGDISKPVDSGFGYHIIKRLDHKPVPALGEVKSELLEKIKKDSERSIYSKEAYIIKLKHNYNFTRNQNAVDDILEKSITWFQKETPEIPAELNGNPVLFSFADNTYSAQQWAEYLRKMAVTSALSNPRRLAELYNMWENQSIIAYEDSHLEGKYPEFRSLMQEYHDGMLLFNISDSKIWQRASGDSAGLAVFYQTNKNKYMWEERYKGMIVKCPNPELKEKVESYLDQGIPLNEIFDMIHITPAAFNVTEGTWSEKENPVIEYYFMNGSKPKDWDENTGFVKAGKIPPEPKLLNEARGYHIADYQQYLEDKWIKELRKKYPVKINKKLLRTLDNG